MIRHGKQPPNIQALLDALRVHEVQFVIVGSVAARLYGADLDPGDIDITPALTEENLQRLTRLLDDLEATPESFGHWEIKPDGERKWVEEDVSPEKLAGWRPEIDDLTTLDHLFYTRYGDFDITPDLAGNFETLRQTAVQMDAYGHKVWVAHIDELLSKLTVPRREKDINRVRKLREIQRSQKSSSAQEKA